MNHLQNKKRIRHPTLKCANTNHQITEVCVNLNCKNNALYCMKPDCKYLELHEDCAHLSLIQFTRQLQKCQDFQFSLQTEIRKTYEDLLRTLKTTIDRQNSANQLPVGDLEKDQQQILTYIYFQGQSANFSSEKAKLLNDKLKRFRDQNYRKLPLLIDSFKEQMGQITAQIIQLQTKTLESLKNELDVGLTQDNRRKLQFQKLQDSKNDEKSIIKPMEESKVEDCLKQMQQDDNLMKLKKYQDKIAFLEQKIKDQDAIFQGLMANQHTITNHPISTSQIQRMHEEIEENLDIQPERDQHSQKLQLYYRRLDKRRASKDYVENEEVLQIYENIADQLRQMHKYNQSNYYYQKGIKLSQSIFKKGGKIQAYLTFWLASNYNQLQKYQKSLQLFQIALKKYQTIKKGNEEQIASTLSNIGNVYFNMAKYEESIQCNRKALEMLKLKKNHSQSDILAYTKNIGQAYYYLQDFEQAQPYFVKCLQLIQSNNLQGLQVKCQCLQKLSQISLEKEQYQSAFLYIASYIKSAKKSQGQIYPYEGKFLDHIRQFVSQKASLIRKKVLLQIVSQYMQHFEEIKNVLLDESFSESSDSDEDEKEHENDDQI